MSYVGIQNKTRPLQKKLFARYCDSFLCKLRGLTFRRELPVDEGLLLVEASDSKMDSSIHMLFVWIDLGIVWVNSDGVVVDKTLARSWHLAYIPDQPAQYVLEINPERLAEFEIGDKISFEEINTR